MIRNKSENRGPIVIDISGPAGNAFALIGNAKAFAKQLGYEKADIDNLVKEMMSGSYENLLQVFDREFGSFVILER